MAKVDGARNTDPDALLTKCLELSDELGWFV